MTLYSAIESWGKRKQQPTFPIPLPTRGALSSLRYVVEEQVCVPLKQRNVHAVVLGGDGDRLDHA